MHRLIAALLVMAVGSTGPASAALGGDADPNLPVNPLSAKTFEVIEMRGAGPHDIWCAAARYTQRSLGKTEGRIYVAEGRGPAKTYPGAMGVVFTTEKPQKVRQSYSISIRVAGQGLLVNHALQFCWNYARELED